MPAVALADESVSIVRRFYSELWNKGDLSIADELIDTDDAQRQPTRGRAR